MWHTLIGHLFQYNYLKITKNNNKMGFLVTWNPLRADEVPKIQFPKVEEAKHQSGSG